MLNSILLGYCPATLPLRGNSNDYLQFFFCYLRNSHIELQNLYLGIAKIVDGKTTMVWYRVLNTHAARYDAGPMEVIWDRGYLAHVVLAGHRTCGCLHGKYIQVFFPDNEAFWDWPNTRILDNGYGVPPGYEYVGTVSYGYCLDSNWGELL